MEHDIIFEDNHILVVVKPQNMPTQEDESKDEDLLNSLKSFIKERDSKPGNVFLGLVHRLDRPTGGVMVFAKTSKAASRLSEQIRDGGFEKKYLAVVQGKLKKPKAKLVHHLLKDETNNIVRVVPSLTTDAKKAELDYSLQEYVNGMSLVSIDLYTGRGHQIRVQMAHIGNPVVGDAKYGKEERAKTKMALWACQLKFDHPTTGKRMNFVVYPPAALPWTEFNIDKILSIK